MNWDFVAGVIVGIVVMIIIDAIILYEIAKSQ